MPVQLGQRDDTDLGEVVLTFTGEPVPDLGL